MIQERKENDAIQRPPPSSSGTLQDMSQVQLVDGNKVFHRQRVLFDIQHARAPEIDNTVSLHAADDLADAVILGAGTVIHQVAQLDVVIRAAVKRVNNRQAVESI